MATPSPVYTHPAYGSPWWIIRLILLVLAILMFLGAAFGVNVASLNLVDLGLACGFASLLPL